MKFVCNPFLAVVMAAFLLAGCGGNQPAATPATQGVNLEGIWKISAPQSSFKPAGGAVPFTDFGRQRYEENKRNQAAGQYDEYDRMTSRCATPGVPRIMLTSDRFEIYQRPDLIAMAFEWNRNRRLIPLPNLPTQQRGFGGGEAQLVGTKMGTPKGHWEGDTLVITTNQFSEVTLIDDLVPHGYDLKVTEHIRLTDADTLENRITIEDPEYFAQPWETVVTYKRQPTTLLRQDVCLDQLLGPPPLPTT